jgi:Tol biopolymer transport system component
MPITPGTRLGPVEDVSAADWAPDGKTLAVVRRIGSEDRLEMPQGHVLVRTSGWLRDIRVSPDGSRVAFVEHPQFHDSRGSVAFADGTGRKTMLTEEYGSVQGVAWSPDGREIWFSAAAVGTRQGLFAVTPLYRGPRLDVFGIDVESGRRRLWRTFEAPDPAGVGVATFIVTRDARSYAYVYERLLDELYLVEGLK